MQSEQKTQSVDEAIDVATLVAITLRPEQRTYLETQLINLAKSISELRCIDSLIKEITEHRWSLVVTDTWDVIDANGVVVGFGDTPILAIESALSRIGEAS